MWTIEREKKLTRNSECLGGGGDNSKIIELLY